MRLSKSIRDSGTDTLILIEIINYIQCAYLTLVSDKRKIYFVYEICWWWMKYKETWNILYCFIDIGQFFRMTYFSIHVISLVQLYYLYYNYSNPYGLLSCKHFFSFALSLLQYRWKLLVNSPSIAGTFILAAVYFWHAGRKRPIVVASSSVF